MFIRVGKSCKIILCTFILCILFGNLNGVTDVKANEKINLSAWLPYWDLDASSQELKQVNKHLNNLIFFGAYFNKDNKLFIPDKLLQQKELLENDQVQYDKYISFVNDKEFADGSVQSKDLDVLRELFSTDEAMQKHIDEIIQIALGGNFDGIEIDYEKIWKDEAVSKRFLNFSYKLYLEALKHNLKVRIVLEPGMPFASTELFKGPEYVVMLYNLYGLHSGPGPKANKAFIEKTLARMAAATDKKAVAFSMGGCVWSENGTKKFISEIEANAIAARMKVKPKRDRDSKCLTYSYKDEDGNHEVWFADIKTLNYWISLAQQAGVNEISIWRLGGNIKMNKVKR